jgi:hypothetical protein
MKLETPRAQLEQSLRLACTWVTDLAQVQTEKLSYERNTHRHEHVFWRGAIRGEYSAATREWDFFAPVWHTGQAVKALVLAHRVLRDGQMLDAARLGADFIGAQRIADKSDQDYGMIAAFEDRGDTLNTSGILEATDGLLLLGDALHEPQYATWACDAIGWVARRAYVGQGMFHDCYVPKRREWVRPPWLERTPERAANRPLIDDGVFHHVYRRTGDTRLREIFLAGADRLLADEDPAGNWIKYPPCNPATGVIHPRHAYWWGLPMLEAYAETKDPRYLACGIRAGEWYLNAMRLDGGLLRDTRRDFKTASFGHETSGICCAMIQWQELWRVTGETRWVTAIQTALKFCLRAQFRETKDPNLRGAILEKVLPPDGTDNSPYHLRDLSTIFYVQAVARLLASPLVAS